MTDAGKILSLYGNWVFYFQGGGFSVFEIPWKQGQIDNSDFNRGLTVTFKAKNSNNCWKRWLKILQAYFFYEGY